MTQDGGDDREPDPTGDTGSQGLAIKLVWAYALLVGLAGLVGLVWLRTTT